MAVSRTAAACYRGILARRAVPACPHPLGVSDVCGVAMPRTMRTGAMVYSHTHTTTHARARALTGVASIFNFRQLFSFFKKQRNRAARAGVVVVAFLAIPFKRKIQERKYSNVV